jgi:hypothetical protein
MSVEVYCQSIGVTEVDDVIKEYFRNTKDLSIPCSQLPSQVRKRMFTHQNRFRQKLLYVLNILEFIHVVTPIRPTNVNKNPLNDIYYTTALAHKYVIERKVDIREIRRAEQPVVQSYTLTSQEDLATYWSDLEGLYRTQQDIPEDEIVKPFNNENERIAYACLTGNKSWKISTIYNSSQRKVLNSYVDKSKGTTPLDNDNLILSIAEDIGSQAHFVRLYYKRVQDVLDDKMEARTIRRIEGGIRRRRKGQHKIDMFGGRRVVRLSDKTLFKGQRHYHKKLRKIYPDAEQDEEPDDTKQSGDEATFMDSLSSLPVLKQGDTRPFVQIRMSKNPWSAHEDELLMYTTAILRLRSNRKYNRFKWAAATQVINKPPINCLRRYGTLSRDPSFNLQVLNYMELWRKFYNEGIANGDIVDENPREMVNFDLLGQVTYFLQRLSEMNEK